MSIEIRNVMTGEKSILQYRYIEDFYEAFDGGTLHRHKWTDWIDVPTVKLTDEDSM